MVLNPCILTKLLLRKMLVLFAMPENVWAGQKIDGWRIYWVQCLNGNQLESVGSWQVGACVYISCCSKLNQLYWPTGGCKNLPATKQLSYHRQLISIHTNLPSKRLSGRLLSILTRPMGSYYNFIYFLPLSSKYAEGSIIDLLLLYLTFFTHDT